MDKDGSDLTQRLDTEIPAETVTDETCLQISPDWDLWERIREVDLDDRTKWSEPINADPMAYFIQALNR